MSFLDQSIHLLSNKDKSTVTAVCILKTDQHI